MSAPLKRALLALLPLLALYVWGINYVGLLSTDEPRYAEIGYEMARDHQWVTPRLWGEPWFEKPALLYWLIAAAYRLGLNDDWAPRLPVALLSIAFLLFYRWIVEREFGSRVALWSTGLLATSAFWLTYGQLGLTDLPLAAFFSAALLLTMRWLRTGERTGLLPAGVCFGAAILAKGLVPIVLALPLLYVGRRRWTDLLLPFAVALAVAAPWYILCTLANGWLFLADFFVKHHFQRFSSEVIQHTQPFWFYVPVLAGLLFPWTPLVGLLRWRTAWREPRTQLLLLTVGFGFLFFSASTNKLPGYLLPLLPSLFLLIGQEIERRAPRPWLGVCLGSLALLPVALAILPDALQTGIRRSVSPTADFTWAMGALSAVLVAALFYWWRWRLEAALAVVAIAMLSFKLLAFRELDQSVAMRSQYRANPIICLSQPPPGRAEVYGLQFYHHAVLPPCPVAANEKSASPFPGKRRELEPRQR